MGQPFNNVRFNAFCLGTYGLFKGASLYSLDVDDRTPLGLLSFGLVISDEYSDCTGTITTSYSACPVVVSSFSACPTVATSWTDK